MVKPLATYKDSPQGSDPLVLIGPREGRKWPEKLTYLSVSSVAEQRSTI